jgi:hypothetical protein
MYAHTGFKEAAASFLSAGINTDFAVFTINGKVIAMTVSVAVLAVVGILVQHRVNRGREFIGDK